jgi:hypothetical protein
VAIPAIASIKTGASGASDWYIGSITPPRVSRSHEPTVRLHARDRRASKNVLREGAHARIFDSTAITVAREVD